MGDAYRIQKRKYSSNAIEKYVNKRWRCWVVVCDHDKESGDKLAEEIVNALNKR